MAGEYLLNSMDFPPLPSIIHNQNKNQQFPSSKSQDRDSSPSNAKIPPLSIDISPEIHESIDIVVGSVIIPQITKPKEKNPVSTLNPKPPSTLLDTQKCLEPQPCSILEAVKDPSHQNCKRDDKVQGVGMSNLAMAFKGNFDLHPCHHISGKACVSFSLEEKQNLINSMNYIVVVKFSHFRPKFQAFNSFLMNMGFTGKFRIMEFDLKHIFVEFLVFEDFVKLWMMKSCIIGGYRGRFFKWDGNFLPTVESFLAPIWVHLPHFPLFLFNEKAILSVASVFGQPIFIDSSSWNRESVGKLSVCVARDVRVKGPNEIMVEFVGNGVIVERFTQFVNYGEIPDYCTRCLHIGHCIEDCKVVSGLDKPLGPVSSRIKVGDVGDIPLSSIFDRIQVDLDKKHKEGEQMLKDCDKVLVEDATDEDNEDCVLADGPSILAEIPLQRAKISDISKALPLEPTLSLEPHNSLGGNNGEKTSGVLENRVNKLQNGSRFGPLAAVNEEEFVVENCVLQEKSAVCVEEASLTRDISLTRSEEEVSPSATESQAENLQNSEKMGAKSAMVCSETDLKNRVLQNSAADSDEEATLLEDFSQLVHGVSEIPKGDERQVDNLQVAEEIKAKSLVECPENSLKVGVLMQSAADFADTPTLKSHTSISGDVEKVLLLEEDSLLSKDHINSDIEMETVGESNEIKDGNSADASSKAGLVLSKDLQPLFCPLVNDGVLQGRIGDVVRWLGKGVGSLVQENLLQDSPFNKDKSNVEDGMQSLVGASSDVQCATSSSHRVVIKHPVTKQVIHLSPNVRSSTSTAPKPLVGLNKNGKKKWKKKHKLDLQNKTSSKTLVPDLNETKAASEDGNDSISNVIVSPLPPCTISQQDWNGLDSNGSKDSHFWVNYHAAKIDLRQVERPDSYPYMFVVDSEEDMLSSSADSQLHPSSRETQSASDSSHDSIDVQSLQLAYHKAADSINKEVFEVNPSSPGDVDTQASGDTSKISSPSDLHSDEDRLSSDLLPLLEAYQKGYFDVDSKNKQSWAEEVEVAASTPLSFDEISGVPVVKNFKLASKKYHKGQFEPP